MSSPIFFDPKRTKNLYGLSDDFIFLKKLYVNTKLPKVLLFSGDKGSGKFTLVNHFMHYIFDNENYNENKLQLNSKSLFHKQFLNDIFSNIIYLSGSNFKNIKVDDIRTLKKKIYQSSILDKPRFIILDDVEIFNLNSLNALLKIIEEPSKKNYFFLINNKSKPIIDTIKSRCLEIKIFFNEIERLKIIESLVELFDINLTIDMKISQLTPGHLIKFNYIFQQNDISFNEKFIKNLEILLNLYKKDKDVDFTNVINFLANHHINKVKNENLLTNTDIFEYKRFVFENIDNYFIYNLSLKTLLNNLSNKINE